MLVCQYKRYEVFVVIGWDVQAKHGTLVWPIAGEVSSVFTYFLQPQQGEEEVRAESKGPEWNRPYECEWVCVCVCVCGWDAPAEKVDE